MNWQVYQGHHGGVVSGMGRSVGGSGGSHHGGQHGHHDAAYGSAGSGHSRLTSSGGVANSSVLRSINDILREDRDLLPVGRTRSSSAHRYDYSASPTRSRYTGGYGSHSRGASPSRAVGGYGGPPTEEERSMERLASTFRTEDYTSSLYERLHDFSPLTSDQEMTGGGQGVCVSDYAASAPAAMPLLPDMPSRSRKLLEDLAQGETHLPRGKYGASSSSSTLRYLSPR